MYTEAGLGITDTEGDDALIDLSATVSGSDVTFCHGVLLKL